MPKTPSTTKKFSYGAHVKTNWPKHPKAMERLK